MIRALRIHTLVDAKDFIVAPPDVPLCQKGRRYPGCERRIDVNTEFGEDDPLLHMFSVHFPMTFVIPHISTDLPTKTPPPAGSDR